MDSNGFLGHTWSIETSANLWTFRKVPVTSSNDPFGFCPGTQNVQGHLRPQTAPPPLPTVTPVEIPHYVTNQKTPKLDPDVKLFNSSLTGVTQLHDDAARREALRGHGRPKVTIKTPPRTPPPTKSWMTQMKRKVGRPLAKRVLVEPSDAVKNVFRVLGSEQLIPSYQRIHSERFQGHLGRRRPLTSSSYRLPDRIKPAHLVRGSTERAVWKRSLKERSIEVTQGVPCHPCHTRPITENNSNDTTSMAYGNVTRGQPPLITRLRRRPGHTGKWTVAYSSTCIDCTQNSCRKHRTRPTRHVKVQVIPLSDEPPDTSTSDDESEDGGTPGRP